MFGLTFRFSSLGKGSHTGYVTAVDQRGIVFHNYDVFFKTDNSSSQEDQYCVYENDLALANQLQTYSQQGKRVTITYQGVRGFGFNLCNNAQILKVTAD